MGFIIFIPIILVGAVAGFVLETVLTPLLPVLEFLLSPVVFNVTMSVLLAVNLLFLVLLMALRSRWSREGRMSRAYAYSFRGWARLGAAIARTALIFAIVWEFAMVFLFGFLLIAQPFRSTAPTSAAPQRPDFNGSWQVADCVAATPDCALSQEEIDACIGAVITYDTILFEKDGTNYLGYHGLTVSDVYYPVEEIHRTNLTAEEFQAQFQFPATDLGYESYVISHDTLVGAGEPQLGQEIVGWWLYWRGAFFQVKQLEEGLT